MEDASRLSGRFASKIDWTYSVVEKKRRLRGHRKAELGKRVIRILTYAAGITGAAFTALSVYVGYYPTLLLPIAQSLLGWALLLAVPLSILNYLTGSTREIIFDNHVP